MMFPLERSPTPIGAAAAPHSLWMLLGIQNEKCSSRAKMPCVEQITLPHRMHQTDDREKACSLSWLLDFRRISNDAFVYFVDCRKWWETINETVKLVQKSERPPHGCEVAAIKLYSNTYMDSRIGINSVNGTWMHCKSVEQCKRNSRFVPTAEVPGNRWVSQTPFFIVPFRFPFFASFCKAVRECIRAACRPLTIS